MKARGRCFLIAGFLATFGLGILNLSATTTLYVWLDSPNPTPPYDTWETAAHIIQEAVDVAEAGSTVLVTNGVYSVGGRDVIVLEEWGEYNWGMSRVVVTNAISLESVNGPDVTIIEGDTSSYNEETGQQEGVDIRCVYLEHSTMLSGFTLTSGNAEWGGGVFSDEKSVVTNCIITSNHARAGGGAAGGTLFDCTLIGNRANARYGGWAGGAYLATLHSCRLEQNEAIGVPLLAVGRGGGAMECTLYDCTVIANKAWYGGGVVECVLFDSTLQNNVGRGRGGGSCESVLYNCVLTDNYSSVGGGGHSTTFFNCTLIGNSASECGGGVSDGSTLYNSILYYNTAPSGANYGIYSIDYGDTVNLNYCCTSPLRTNGVGNITGPPLFMDLEAGDSRLREGSPCIDAGTNLLGFSMTTTNAESGEVSVFAYTHTPTDILGNTRFIDGNGDEIVAWDIGAYEFNSFPPPKFNVQPELTSNGWKFTITGAPNKWVGLQRTSDFSGWWDLQPPVFTGSDGSCEITDSDTEPKVMFYRVVVR